MAELTYLLFLVRAICQPYEIKNNGDLIGSDNKLTKTIKNYQDCLKYELTSTS